MYLILTFPSEPPTWKFRNENCFGKNTNRQSVDTKIIDSIVYRILDKASFEETYIIFFEWLDSCDSHMCNYFLFNIIFIFSKKKLLFVYKIISIQENCIFFFCFDKPLTIGREYI